jgi:DNA-binding transcriptional LysR family regulator
MNDSLDSRQVKAFVVLTQTGSYTETAKRLYVTHSAISHSMKALEEQLGCRLFYKLGKKITPTEAGEAFLHHARRVIEEMRLAHVTLGQFKRWGTRRLRLAVESVFPTSLLNPALVRFHAQMPGVTLQVDFCRSGGSVQRLEDNQADIVFAERSTRHERLEFIPLLTDRARFVAHREHPLIQAGTVARDQVGKHPCVLLREPDDTRQRLEHSLSRRGFRLNVVAEIENVDMVKHLVRETGALSLLPHWTVAPELQSRIFSIVPLPFNAVERTWGMFHLPARPLNHAEATLLRLCQDELKKSAKHPEPPAA